MDCAIKPKALGAEGTGCDMAAGAAAGAATGAAAGAVAVGATAAARARRATNAQNQLTGMR
jgi:hypothetical protein